MTQKVSQSVLGRMPESVETGYTPNGGRVPNLNGDVRPLVPKLGLREYWYPLIGTRRIGKTKPSRVRLMGEDLCVFRGAAKDEFVALNDICPHRGARLSEGDCHYDGTVSCPYHGWTFDGSGTNVAVLSEGPTSIVCGKPGTEARSYPTQVLKGIIFVWMGEGEPAPIEEDVPEEFFDAKTRLFFNDRIIWRTNWEVALENSMDAHAGYLHRDALQRVLANSQVTSGGIGGGRRPIFTGNGFRSGTGGGGNRGAAGTGQAVFPQGWKWPKSRWRRYWSWFFGPLLFSWTTMPAPALKDPERWVDGHRLPGLFRALPTPRKGGFIKRWLSASNGISVSHYGLYTRQTVAIDEWLTRVWYFYTTAPKNRLMRLWYGFIYFSFARWFSEYNFSQQDMSVMLNQSWANQEMLSITDTEVVQWRKLVVTKHFGGREYPFQYSPPQAVDIPSQPVDTQAAPVPTTS